MSLPTFTATKHRVGRQRRVTSAVAPPVNLTLIAASYATGTSVTLVFDRPIDIDAIDGSQITVIDAISTHTTFKATGTVTIVSPTTVRLGLRATGSATGAGTRLTATASNGIVAQNDGGPWAGATELGLPFP